MKEEDQDQQLVQGQDKQNKGKKMEKAKTLPRKCFNNIIIIYILLQTFKVF